ncbi:hypothetical protein BJX66DRAFT_292571 [Aspergillus keveii]|uniref:Uncharacterized protein n=1 Tax=Aspergillus keveii TaxID=714993 RepID=A0ABR4GMC9_9EURO
MPPIAKSSAASILGLESDMMLAVSELSPARVIMRSMIHWFVCNGYNISLLNSLECRDTKVSHCKSFSRALLTHPGHVGDTRGVGLQSSKPRAMHFAKPFSGGKYKCC